MTQQNEVTQQDAPAPSAPSSQGNERHGRVLLLGLALMAIGGAGIALTLSAVWLFLHDDQAPLVSESPAGTVLRVELQGGLFSRSLVETDLGYYSLVEGVSLRKAEALTVKERRDGARELCDSSKRCTRLLRGRP